MSRAASLPGAELFLKKTACQEFWDSCAQKTSEISETALSGIMGLLCAEQNVGNLKHCTFINTGTPVRRGGRPSAASFVLAVNTGHILVLRRKTCALLRAKASALLRRKTCAVLRARACTWSRINTKLTVVEISDVLFCELASKEA